MPNQPAINKLNKKINFRIIPYSFKIIYQTTADTCVRSINFKLANHRVLTNKTLFTMNLVPDPYCKYYSEIKSDVHAFVECRQIARLWRQVEMWLRIEHVDRHAKITDLKGPLGQKKENYLMNAVLLATKEMIYRKRQIGGSPTIIQIQRILYNQMIKEYFLISTPSELELTKKSGYPCTRIT